MQFPHVKREFHGIRSRKRPGVRCISAAARRESVQMVVGAFFEKSQLLRVTFG